MSRLIRFEPFRELRRSTWGGFPFFEDDVEFENNLTVDVYEADGNVIVVTDLPGVKPDDVDVEVTSDTVTIKAEKKEEIEEKGKDYLRRERHYGKFARTVNLPEQVEASKASAEFDGGTLRLTLPKQEQAAKRRVEVKSRKETV